MELARIEGRSEGSRVVARVVGEIDASNAPDVAERIAGMVEDEASGLVVDLAGTEYMDSAGIRMLFELRARLESNEQGMAIVLPGDSPVRQVLTIAEVPQVIPLAESTEGAARAMADR